MTKRVSGPESPDFSKSVALLSQEIRSNRWVLAEFELEGQGIIAGVVNFQRDRNR